MGAQCVRLSPKLSPHTQYKRELHTSKIRASDEILQFQLIISDLELQCTSNNVGKVIFSVDKYVNLEFSCEEFFLLDKMIRCISQKRASFSVHAKNIEFLQFKVSILDTKGAKIEKVSLKMHAVCQGPKLHDHLLKQMKARIVYNLEITQLVCASLGCSDYKIYDSKKNDISQDYGLSLDMIIPGKDSLQTDQKKILFTRNPQEQQKYFKNNIPSKKLKQSLFRIMIHKTSSMGLFPQTNLQPQLQICIPYMKFWSQDDMSVISQKNGQRVFEKINLKYYQKLKDCNDSIIDVYLELNLKTSKIYLEQIECLIFSQNGLKTVSPYLLSNRTISSLNNALSPRDLEIYENLFKKQRKVTYQTKNQIQKSIKDCYNYLFQQGKTKICHLSDLELVQTRMLNILNSLSQLITQGQDVTNQSIWLLIDKIIHRPQLSTNYLYLIQNPLQKTQIGLKYYGFIFAMLSKIILCTTMGLTYHQLKCIQKFIGYVYFRLHWIQDLVINALKRKDDPQFTNQKMMQIGVYINNKSPSKSVVYDWQQCLLPHVKNDPRYRQISNDLLQTSQSVPKWSQLLFNRDDDDLYYGLIIQIWSQAQIFLNNQGRIMWEYFPNYAELLGTFLGEMNKNKIMDYSSLFSQCSMKLISNQKLLNNFVMFLFPKTCLYETYCVIKCLELINSYFQAISKKNKKMPSQFNFNYFYTGIRCIFQSNHSYLLIRVIGLLYDYYHIFSIQFKKSLDSFILSKGFNQIFLHWCGYARRMFYLLLEHRINIKYRQQQQLGLGGERGLGGGIGTCMGTGLGTGMGIGGGLHTAVSLNSPKGSLSFQGIQRMQQFKNLIQNLENQQKKLLKQKKNQINMQRSKYHIKMKQRLTLKKQQKKQQQYQQQQYQAKIQKQSQSSYKQLYTSIEFQQQYQMVRKNTHYNISSQKQLFKTNRKWSTFNNDQGNICQVSQDLKKYIIVAMKQYREIKGMKNPDEEVKKIMKIFNNNKTIDN